MKPWVFAIIGSLLILGSSWISGVYVSKLEANLIDEQSAITQKQAEFTRATTAYDNAIIHKDLSSISRSIVRNGAFHKIDEVQTIWDSVHASSLYAVHLELRSSANMSLDDKDTSDIKKLLELSESGDYEAYQELQKLTSDLIVTSANYRAQLVLDIADLEKVKSQTNKDITNSKNIAIFVQLLGLVFLLFKEVPSNLLYRQKLKEESAEPCT
ncbi:hypothetical protein [Vibrio parahaemolyticus]|uniref:hypothetical protein n=1 Tax=Vibrio parahaemolyticus TaxID=670 RepID=UPI0004DF0A10|nr:hypothetical protein [Vibrio parahaemolyticus]